jgi:hypothetical protein
LYGPHCLPIWNQSTLITNRPKITELMETGLDMHRCVDKI